MEEWSDKEETNDCWRDTRTGINIEEKLNRKRIQGRVIRR